MNNNMNSNMNSNHENNKKNKIVKIVLIVVAIFVLLKILGSCGNNNSNNSDLNNSSGTNQSTSYTVEINDLMNEFSDNQTAALNKYKGKTLTVIGYFNGVAVDPDGKYNLTVNDGSFAGYGFHCFIDESEYNYIKSLNLNNSNKITVTGTVKGYFLQVNADNCTIKR